jgi:cytoskeletal protein RodZ
MMKRLLAQMKAMQEKLDLDQEKTIAKMDANQEKMDTKIDANQERLEAEMKPCKKNGS